MTVYSTRVAAWVALGLFGAAGSASAAILTVGAPGSGCDHTDIQAAVNAAEAAPGADTIRIARSSTWTAQQVVINTQQDLELVGGYANCNASAPTSPNTTLSGAGGDARPVFSIQGNGVIRLRRLNIVDGDASSGGFGGGGISYRGGGILDIADASIADNIANSGGGIYAEGTSTVAELILGANVNVQNNIARIDGGGVYANAIEFSFTGPNSSILLNQAQGQSGGGFGGGVLIKSSAFVGYGYISSNGIGGLGAIHGNSAVHGGGIAVYAGRDSGKDAVVQIFSTDPNRATRISANTASQLGGAIYLDADTDSSNGDADAVAVMRFVAFEGNEAAAGSALYLYGAEDINGPEGGKALVSTAGGIGPITLPGSALPCPVGGVCARFADNVATTPSGAVISLRRGAWLSASRTHFVGNRGSNLFEFLGGEGKNLFVSSSLIERNVLGAVIDQPTNDDQTYVVVSGSTITGNDLSSPFVIRARDRFFLDSSIIWQPGTPSLSGPSAIPDIADVLTNDAAHMPAGSAVVRAPRFIDPANHNYRLRAGSWGVDRVSFNVARQTLDGAEHDVDLPRVGLDGSNRYADIGAYERPAIQPLVLNSNFDQSLNLWDGVSNEAGWDAAQNASGPAGSGSMRLQMGGPKFIGSSQCVHLPAPGRYLLNGWGRVQPGNIINPTRAELRWQLFPNGAPMGCGGGVVSGSGTHQLASNLTWTRPAQPAEVVVTEAEWTINTALVIQPRTTGGLIQPMGWFDGITLTLDSETLFENGFE